MKYVVTPAQMRALDAHMIREQGIPGVVLMERAAMGVTNAVRKLIGQAAEKSNSAGILCGVGNNGGDGLAVLRQLAMHGVPAWAALLGNPALLQGDARLQYKMATGAGLQVYVVQDVQQLRALPWESAAVLVDALFGTGLSRPLAGIALEAVQCMNAARAKVVAVDIPSGIDGTTGQVLGDSVRADVTVTFQHKKLGHLLLPGRMCTGELFVTPIGLPAIQPHAAEEWEREDVRLLLPARAADSHKGKNGRALLLAGSGKYAGAALLAATAALRAGCGLLYAGMPKEIHSMFSACPAAISQPVGAGGEWDAAACKSAIAMLEGKDALALGPGMGQGEGIPALLQAALETQKPIVIDADGLNALARNKALLRQLHACVILTPHPGEMARLMDIAREDILQSPIQTAQDAAKEWGCTVLLKGATSVIAQGGRTCLNTTGNPGLAKGGSGDVLTGILLGLLAQGIQEYEAACAGAYLLGASADAAVELLGNRALLPTDVVEWITRSIDERL